MQLKVMYRKKIIPWMRTNYAFTAYTRGGLYISFFFCLRVLQLRSFLVSALLMARVRLGRRSRGLYFLPAYSFLRFVRWL